MSNPTRDSHGNAASNDKPAVNHGDNTLAIQFKEFDKDNDESLSKEEFTRALMRIVGGRGTEAKSPPKSDFQRPLFRPPPAVERVVVPPSTP